MKDGYLGLLLNIGIKFVHEFRCTFCKKGLLTGFVFQYKKFRDSERGKDYVDLEDAYNADDDIGSPEELLPPLTFTTKSLS